jgi:dCTP deaminase
MILSGLEIKKRLGKDIEIEPFNEKQLNPNSYNLRLHNELLVYNDPVLDMKKENNFKKLIIPEYGLVLEPGKLYLGRTIEKTSTHNLVPKLEGRSSIGRLGVHIHVTAGLGHVGAKGHWTLEIFCIQPVKIYPDIEVCQVYYHELLGEYEDYRNGKYHDNSDVQPSMMYKEFPGDDK